MTWLNVSECACSSQEREREGGLPEDWVATFPAGEQWKQSDSGEGGR